MRPSIFEIALLVVVTVAAESLLATSDVEAAKHLDNPVPTTSQQTVLQSPVLLPSHLER